MLIIAYAFGAVVAAMWFLEAALEMPAMSNERARPTSIIAILLALLWPLVLIISCCGARIRIR
jgi:carbon starvation protein CstA